MAMEDLREQVGTIPLIIENIVKHCNKETKLNCRLVNSEWGTEALKYLRIHNWENGRNGTFEALLEKPLSPFRKVIMFKTFQPQLLDYLRTSLKSLELKNVVFADVTELSNVVFNAFPYMKNLILDKVAVKKQGQHDVSDASNGITQGTTSLETLTIKLDVARLNVCGVEALGLNVMFQKFNKLKRLTYHMWNGRTTPDLFGELLLAKLVPTYLEFYARDLPFGSVHEYLTKYGGQLLHFRGLSPIPEGNFENVVVKGWISARLDGVNWRTFGRGTFENLSRLELAAEQVDCFDFLTRMPALKEIKFVDPIYPVRESPVTCSPVIALDRNPPCKSVTVLYFDTRPILDSRKELLFHVFPNVTELHLVSCNDRFLSQLVMVWENLTKLHIGDVDDVDAAFITENVTRLKYLEHFEYFLDVERFGDDEGKKFLSHLKLEHLRLGGISMTPQMIRRLERALHVFEYYNLNGVAQSGTWSSWNLMEWI